MTQSTGVITVRNVGRDGAYQPSAAYNAYLQTTYIDTGMLTVEHTREGSMLQTFVNFRSAEDRATFTSDPVIVAEAAQRSAFYADKGSAITSTIE